MDKKLSNILIHFENTSYMTHHNRSLHKFHITKDHKKLHWSWSNKNKSWSKKKKNRNTVNRFLSCLYNEIGISTGWRTRGEKYFYKLPVMCCDISSRHHNSSRNAPVHGSKNSMPTIKCCNTHSKNPNRNATWFRTRPGQFREMKIGCSSRLFENTTTYEHEKEER